MHKFASQALQYRNQLILAILLTVSFVFFQANGLEYLRLNPDGQITVQRLQEFLTFFLSILVQATPFLVLGTVLSTAAAIWIKEEWILKLVPRNRITSHIFVSLFGILLPVCECGNIPIARRMIQKGFSMSHAITFLLAAPVINPLTIWSTWEAFPADRSVVIIRVVAAFIIANVIGILFSYAKNQSQLLNPNFHQVITRHLASKQKYTWQDAISIFQSEFMSVFKMLIVGAVLASISITFVPRSVIETIGQTPTLSVLAMLILAFVVSICSSIDAFFALAYADTFTTGALLTFLVFGPMIDIKVLSLLRNTFRKRTLVLITLLVALFSLIVGLAVNYLL